MEYRIKDYSISGNSITLPRKTGIEDIRLIYNETQKILICSTAKKDNLSGVGAIVVNNFTNTTLINVPTNVCVLQPNDMLTIKCDYGDEGATETTLNSAKEEILTAVEKGAQESTLLAESEAIKQAIASAKPEVDLSGVESGLQEVKHAVENIDFTPIEEKIDNIDLSSIKGENQEATNSAIYETLNYIKDDVIDIVQSQLTEVDNLLDF